MGGGGGGGSGGGGGGGGGGFGVRFGFRGGGGRSDIDWVGYGKGIIGAYLARRRTRREMYEALEAVMAERGLPIPPRPMSQEKVFVLGFLSGLFLGLLIGLIFWELT